MNTSSSPQIESQVETLIVGAGPTGLAAACELRRRGHEVVVIDAGVEGSNTSRAAVIHARTLEVLEPLQLTPRLTAEGVVVPVFTMRDRDRVLARIDFSHLPTKYPYTLMLPQYRTEQLLTTRLTELGGAVHRQIRLTGLTQYDGMAVTELTRPDGSLIQVECQYLIGADGLHSAVRELTGIAFEGRSYPQAFVLADVTLDWPLPPDEVQLFFSAAGLVVIAPLPHGHHRIVATVDAAPEHPDLGDLQALLDTRGPGHTQVRELVWASRFRVQHRIAAHYRAGAAFLVGDAAHVHSPAGGQGMNIGIQDAVDLAATVAEAEDSGDQTLLDGYEQRRRPVAREVVRFTDRTTRAASLRSPAARRVRNVALSAALRAPVRQQRLAHRLAELR